MSANPIPAPVRRVAFDPSWLQPRPDHEPTYTLDRQIAEARREMGEATWKRLNDEWLNPSGKD